MGKLLNKSLLLEANKDKSSFEIEEEKKVNWNSFVGCNGIATSSALIIGLRTTKVI